MAKIAFGLHITGATIGAARLDSLFEQAVLDRLIAADKNSPLGLPDLTKAAWSMRMSKQYQYVCHKTPKRELLVDINQGMQSVSTVQRNLLRKKTSTFQSPNLVKDMQTRNTV